MITPESIVAKDQSEYAHQVAFFCWAATSGIPDIDLMFHIPNGERRDSITGGRLKASGVKPGVPDVCWPVAKVSQWMNQLPIEKWHSLWVEFKVGKNEPTRDQKDYHRRLRALGHYVVVCYNWQEAKEHILWYNSLR